MPTSASRHQPARTFSATTFLNVDLELTSTEDLASLAEALRPAAFALHVGRTRRYYRAALELSRTRKTPDAALRRLVMAVRELSPKLRQQWRTASSRDFNIGIQAASEPPSREFVIHAKTLAMVAAVGGRLVITVYGGV